MSDSAKHMWYFGWGKDLQDGDYIQVHLGYSKTSYRGTVSRLWTSGLTKLFILTDDEGLSGPLGIHVAQPLQILKRNPESPPAPPHQCPDLVELMARDMIDDALDDHEEPYTSDSLAWLDDDESRFHAATDYLSSMTEDNHTAKAVAERVEELWKERTQ